MTAIIRVQCIRSNVACLGAAIIFVSAYIRGNLLAKQKSCLPVLEETGMLFNVVIFIFRKDFLYWCGIWIRKEEGNHG
jgi:hypothetical protein